MQSIKYCLDFSSGTQKGKFPATRLKIEHPQITLPIFRVLKWSCPLKLISILNLLFLVKMSSSIMKLFFKYTFSLKMIYISWMIHDVPFFKKKKTKSLKNIFSIKNNYKKYSWAQKRKYFNQLKYVSMKRKKITLIFLCMSKKLL